MYVLITEFIKFFISGFIGVLIYEALIYVSAPFEPDWINLMLEVLTITLVISIIGTLVKWWKNKTSAESESKT